MNAVQHITEMGVEEAGQGVQMRLAGRLKLIAVGDEDGVPLGQDGRKGMTDDPVGMAGAKSLDTPGNGLFQPSGLRFIINGAQPVSNAVSRRGHAVGRLASCH